MSIVSPLTAKSQLSIYKDDFQCQSFIHSFIKYFLIMQGDRKQFTWRGRPPSSRS